MWSTERGRRKVSISECVFSEVQAKLEERVGYHSCSNAKFEVPTFGRYFLQTSPRKKISKMIKCIFVVMYEAIILYVLTYEYSVPSGKYSQIEYLGTETDRKRRVPSISRVAFTYNLSARSVGYGFRKSASFIWKTSDLKLTIHSCSRFLNIITLLIIMKS